MNKAQDAFGQLLVSCHRGDNSLEIVERDDGFIEAGSGNRYFTAYEDWPAHHKRAMRYVKGRVLDVGSGGGSHSIFCQDKGYSVLAIDISPLAIQVAKRRGLRDGKVMSVAQVGSLLGIFDSILMMGNNFGTFGSSARAKRLLKRFCSMTSPNARIIAETRDPYRTSDRIHKEYHKRNRKRGKLGGQVRIRIRFRNLKTPWFDYLLVSKEEMKQILKGTGWSVGTFLDTRGACYIAVLEKT